MTLPQFDHGYWYATELKAFAKSLGIPSAGKLRKDELEKVIRIFIETGKIESPTRIHLPTSGTKDVERGLKLSLPVAVYTNDRETKAFLEREAQKMALGLKRKSGARYRLNRWREEQLLNGEKITYADLVEEYVRLNQLKEPFQQIPHGRYINFRERLLRSREGSHQRTSLASLGRAQETGHSQELSCLGEMEGDGVTGSDKRRISHSRGLRPRRRRPSFSDTIRSLESA